jgi:molecular chaperone IbpA
MIYHLPIPTFDFISDLHKQIEEIDKPYPPTNIWSTKDATYISMALAGFKKSELDIEIEKNVLIIKGKPEKDDSTKDITWRQRHISNKSFIRKFPLAEYAEIKSATYNDGLLVVELILNIPEEKKPKKYLIE